LAENPRPHTQLGAAVEEDFESADDGYQGRPFPRLRPSFLQPGRHRGRGLSQGRLRSAEASRPRPGQQQLQRPGRRGRLGRSHEHHRFRRRRSGPGRPRLRLQKRHQGGERGGAAGVPADPRPPHRCAARHRAGRAASPRSPTSSSLQRSKRPRKRRKSRPCWPKPAPRQGLWKCWAAPSGRRWPPKSRFPPPWAWPRAPAAPWRLDPRRAVKPAGWRPLSRGRGQGRRQRWQSGRGRGGRAWRCHAWPGPRRRGRRLRRRQVRVGRQRGQSSSGDQAPDIRTLNNMQQGNPQERLTVRQPRVQQPMVSRMDADSDDAPKAQQQSQPRPQVRSRPTQRPFGLGGGPLPQSSGSDSSGRPSPQRPARTEPFFNELRREALAREPELA